MFIAEFAFISATPGHQPGLFFSVSPDSGEGSRMSWVGLEDTVDGIRVTVNDAPDVDGAFVSHHGPLLDRGIPHRIRFWIRVNPGPDDDLVRISVDGKDLGQCFTTWENYYRTSPEQAPAERQYAAGHQQPAVPLRRAGAPCARRSWLRVRQREHHSA